MLVACGGAQTPGPGASPEPSPRPSPESPPEPGPEPGPDPAPRPTPPWQQPALRADDVPAVFMQEWRAAPNRETCAAIAPASTGVPNATARGANFGGGWAVAYDLADLRSAFGVAGTGVDAADPSYADWPHGITWSDGSTTGYGPEGGSGPNQLAYLRIVGQGCLYNVWSRVSREHLEQLLAQLRFVEQT